MEDCTRPRILTVIGDQREPAYAASFAAALAAAQRSNATLVIGDRTAETWADTPHVHTDLTIDGAVRARRYQLADRLVEAEAAGVDAFGVLASLPSPTSYEDVLTALGEVALVVLPERLQRPRLGERLQGRDMAATAHRSRPDIPVLAVTTDGTTTLLETVPTWPDRDVGRQRA